MGEKYQEIDDFIQEHRGEMILLWEKLVNIESGPQQKEGVSQVIDVLLAEMEKLSMETRVVAMEKAGDLLIGTWNGESTRKPILFLGHTDTVFSPEVTKKNPFTIDDEGRAYGPGVLDMKGGLVIALYTLKALDAIGYRDRPVKFIIAGDEETIHKNSNADEVMAAEMRGAKIALNFETGYPDDGIVVGRKGGGVVSVRVQGVAAHSGIAPEKGRNAILEAANKIMHLEAANDLQRGKLINCGVINGGLGENTIADECEIRVGYRFPTMEIKKEIMDTLDWVVDTVAVEGTSAAYSIEMNMDCMETTDGVMELFEHFRKAASSCGYGEVHPFTVGGISDSAISVVAGVPTICGLGCKGLYNHTLKEYAEVESLYSRTKLAACGVIDFK